MSNVNKTHYRKAFNSPYLSSADIVGPTNLTIARVVYAKDATKKTKDQFNTAHFVEKEIRAGEKLKPMILNATNCKTLKGLTNTPFIEDWVNIHVTVYVDNNVKNRGQIVDGLRISPVPPVLEKQWLTKDNADMWGHAVASYSQNGNLNAVLEHVNVSQENADLIIKEAQNV
jgi:hypothetical protein